MMFEKLDILVKVKKITTNEIYIIWLIISDIEVALSNLGGLDTCEIAKKHKTEVLNENIKVVRFGGNVARKCKNKKFILDSMVSYVK